MNRRPETVSLVLGSGGARGHAHIGVIRALEERNLTVRSIAGTSMGALIGGIYASGKLDTYVRWAIQLRKTDVVRLLDFSFTRTALFKGERIIEVLKDLIGDRKIADLPEKTAEWMRFALGERARARRERERLSRTAIPYEITGGAGLTGVDFYPRLLPLESTPGETRLYSDP